MLKIIFPTRLSTDDVNKRYEGVFPRIQYLYVFKTILPPIVFSFKTILLNIGKSICFKLKTRKYANGVKVKCESNIAGKRILSELMEFRSNLFTRLGKYLLIFSPETFYVQPYGSNFQGLCEKVFLCRLDPGNNTKKGNHIILLLIGLPKASEVVYHDKL